MSVRFTPPSDLSPYQGFIFDCDGTVADTMPAHFEAWRRAIKEGGGDFDFTWDIFVSRAGMTMERTVTELQDQFRVILDRDIIAKRQREIFRELDGDIQPIEEVLSFAREVAQRFPIAIASGSIRPSVDRTLRTIGALDLFPVIVTPEDVENGKPAPDMFLLAAKKLGVAPSSCLVLEDGALGIEAARRAQMPYAVVDSPPPQ